MESKEARYNIVLSVENLTSSISNFDLVFLKSNLLKEAADIAMKFLLSEIIVVYSRSPDCIVIKKPTYTRTNLTLTTTINPICL